MWLIINQQPMFDKALDKTQIASRYDSVIEYTPVYCNNKLYICHVYLLNN